MSGGRHGMKTGPADTALVLAARSGNDRALGDLLAAYLPLVYNIVRRALSDSPDVDDVVQEIMLLAVRDLATLREPESFRSWLVAIVFHQISTYRHGRRQLKPTAAIEEAEDLEAAGSDVQDLALLRLDVSGQRRQAVEASRWLDHDQRSLLSLWWQENAGHLTRSEVAEAVGLTVAHTAVRLQRMREQLEVGRQITAALAARPRCAVLDTVVGAWDGRRTPLWRKRIGRHVNDCPVCSAAASGLIPLDRLLHTFAAIPIPLGLAAAVTAKGLAWTPAASAAAGAAHASIIGKLAQAIAAHPLATAAAGAVLIAAPVITYATLPEAKPPAAIAAAPPASPSAAARVSPSPRPSPVRSSPAPSAGLALGTWSLEIVGAPGQFISYATTVYATVEPVTAASPAPARQRATFTVVKGLADAHCYTFRAADGRYLRHMYLRLRLSAADSTQLFREDATFCVKPGSVAGSITLQSHNYPGSVLRMRDGGIFLDGSDGTPQFARDSSFIRREPWA
jgi:RNA polymerase sigma factor (sigma-70 family)